MSIGIVRYGFLLSELENVLLRNFRIPPGNVLEIFKIMNYFFNRIQIKIVHLSEIDSLLGNQGLDFLFVR